MFLGSCDAGSIYCDDTETREMPVLTPAQLRRLNRQNRNRSATPIPPAHVMQPNAAIPYMFAAMAAWAIWRTFRKK